MPGLEFRDRSGGMSETTFWRLVKTGELTVHRIGRKVIVFEDDAERYWCSLPKGVAERPGDPRYRRVGRPRRQLATA